MFLESGKVHRAYNQESYEKDCDACGGTGGHLTPGIALSQSLYEQETSPGSLFKKKKVVDSRLSRKYSCCNLYPCLEQHLCEHQWGSCGFYGSFGCPFSKHIHFVEKKEINAIVVFGGFTSLGPAMAARWLGIPVFTHEANRAVGKAVRFVGRHSKRLYLPEGMHVEGISSEIVRNIGYPLRQDFRRIPGKGHESILAIRIQNACS